MIREARADDAHAIGELARQLGYEGVALSEADGVVLVIERDGVVRGWLQVSVVRTIHAGTNARVHALVVDETYRGSGLGGALLDAAEEWARGQGARSVRLGCNVTRSRAHEFYEQRFYRRAKTQHVFTKRL